MNVNNAYKKEAESAMGSHGYEGYDNPPCVKSLYANPS